MDWMVFQSKASIFSTTQETQGEFFAKVLYQL